MGNTKRTSRLVDVGELEADLCLRFVANSYDLEIIREEERKQ